jgi:hypothetical protein
MRSTTGQGILIGAALGWGTLAAHADVSMNVTTAGKASFLNVGGEGITQISGNRMRSEQTIGGNVQTLIIDIDGRRFITLDGKKKSALVTPLDSIRDELQKVGLSDIQATLTPTAETKTVAGFSCTVHDVKATFPFSLSGQPGQGMDVTMLLAGTVCLSPKAPGVADYQRFYKAAADSGFIFGDPRSAKSPQGAATARAYASLTRKMSEAGMALESHITISAAGGGPMAAMMGSLVKGDITTTLTQITEGAVAAEAFEIPAGYKVKTQD